MCNRSDDPGFADGNTFNYYTSNRDSEPVNGSILYHEFDGSVVDNARRVYAPSDLIEQADTGLKDWILVTTDANGVITTTPLGPCPTPTPTPTQTPTPTPTPAVSYGLVYGPFTTNGSWTDPCGSTSTYSGTYITGTNNPNNVHSVENFLIRNNDGSFSPFPASRYFIGTSGNWAYWDHTLQQVTSTGTC